MARLQAKLSLSWFGLARFKPNSVCPDLGWPVSSQTQFVLIWAGPSQAKLRKWLRGLKQTVFFRFYSVFCPIFFASRQTLCTWHGYFVKKIGLRLLFAAVHPTETKVRHSTGVATTNSTNRYPNANKLSWAINYCITDCDHLQPGNKSAMYRSQCMHWLRYIADLFPGCKWSQSVIQ